MSEKIQNPTEKNRVTSEGLPSWAMEQIMQQEQQSYDERMKNGESPKIVYWEQFLDTQAEKPFEQYLQFCKADGENIEEICYGLFLDFWQGRRNFKMPKIIKSVKLAEMAISKIQNSRDTKKLISIVTFYEENNEAVKAEGFYLVLCDLFSNGEDTEQDLNQAAKYLKCAINITNTSDRRNKLREIYEWQNNSPAQDVRTCKAYEKMIAENVRFARTDYANYLKSHDKRREAVHWLIEDEKYEDAYKNINLHSKKEIDDAVSELKKGAADSEFSNSLKLMQSSYEQLQNILSYKETPLSYLRISILYSIPLIGLIYALYHTAKLNVKFFILGFVLTIAAGIGAFVNFGKIEIGLLAVVTSISIWAIISLIVDIQRRRKFISSREIWKKLRNSSNYQKWSEGFKTTVSSKVSNLEIVGASNDEYTIKFNLEAVDNPGGTRNFNGTAVIIKENNEWKIYSVNHKRIN